MDEIKHYMDIPRLGHKTTQDYLTQIASKGLNIRIGLKLDGSNGQFEVNKRGELLVYSRRGILDEENNLRRFYQYVNSKVDPSKLPIGYKIFGEWLTSHTVQYPQDMYGHFYLFSVYDSENKVYISHESEVFKQIYNYLVLEVGMREEFVLYEGPYKGIDHINDIVKKVTRENEEYVGQAPKTFDDVFHEGIVIKSHEYRDKYGHQLFVKVVGKRFEEVKKVRFREPKQVGPDTSVEGQIVEFTVTHARVEKMLNKLIDESLLPEDFDLENMPVIARNLPKRIYEDIMKEELDTIKDEFGEFDSKIIGKKMNNKVLKLVKNIIAEKVEQRLKNL